jgi:hypothetical protein
VAVPVESIFAILLALVLLGLWMLYANEAGVPIGELLRLSGWYFLAPILLIVALAHSIPAFVLLLVPFIVLIEEGLKRDAAREVASDPEAIFCLVSLYGLWELAVAKALMPFLPDWSPVSGRWPLAIFVWLIALPVVMHCATAAIYAFYPGVRRRFRFWACAALHWLFNASRAAYGLENGFGEVSVAILVADTALWVALLVLLVRKGRSTPPMRTCPGKGSGAA